MSALQSIKEWLDVISGDICKEVYWVESPKKNSLVARKRMRPSGWEVGLNEQDMIPVHQWCKEHNCGRRTSFDTFQFRNKKEMTMFLLKWGSRQ